MNITLSVDWGWLAVIAAAVLCVVRPRQAWAVTRGLAQIGLAIFLLFVAAWPRR